MGRGRRRRRERSVEGSLVVRCALNVWESLWTDYSRWNASFFPFCVSPYTWRAGLASLWRQWWRRRRRTSCGQSCRSANGTTDWPEGEGPRSSQQTAFGHATLLHRRLDSPVRQEYRLCFEWCRIGRRGGNEESTPKLVEDQREGTAIRTAATACWENRERPRTEEGEVDASQ